MAQRSSSAMLNKIRRELARRRKVINVAKGGVVKKTSAAPPPPPIPSVSGAGAATCQGLGAGAATLKKSSALLPHPRVLIRVAISGAANKIAYHQETTGADTEYVRKPSSAPIKKRSWSISVKKGMTVKVRVPARILTTGQRVVIVHPAVVVSDAEDGYLEVVYSGYPRDRTVRIALDQVKNMPPTK